MPIVSGSTPLALPGGQAEVSRPPERPDIPMVNRFSGEPKVGFVQSKAKTKPAFRKKGKRAF